MNITQNAHIADTVIMAVVTAWHDVHGYSVSPKAVKGKNKMADIVACRHMAHYILRTHYGWTLARIGHVFSQDHSTVVHSCKAVEQALSVNAKEVSALPSAMSYINDLAHENNSIKSGENSLFDMYMLSRKREKTLIGQVKHLRRELVKADARNLELRTKLEEYEDATQYVKPMEWTPDEKRRLKQVREIGLTEVR